MVLDERLAIAEENEPIVSETRRVRPNSGDSETSPICNLTQYAPQVVGLSPGVEAEVHVYREFLIIAPSDGGGVSE